VLQSPITWQRNLQAIAALAYTEFLTMPLPMK
jgi:hypothetical protein